MKKIFVFAAIVATSLFISVEASNLEKTGKNIGREADKGISQGKHAAHKAGKNIKKGAKKAGHSIKDGARNVVHGIKNGAKNIEKKLS